VFNLTGSEIVIILLLALVVLGPDKLPEAMRRAGRTWAEIKKISSGFQEEVRKGFEEPATEMKKTASAVKEAASFAHAPMKSAQKAAKGAAKSLLDPPKTQAPSDGAPAADEPAGDAPVDDAPVDDVPAGEVVGESTGPDQGTDS
jgi:sec-independent protein translocase protein TatB